MAVLAPDIINRLQNIIELPRNKQEEVLSAILNAIPADAFDDVVNNKLGAVTPQAVREYGLACFHKVDTRPNPPDGYITIDEVAELISRSKDTCEQAVLLFIWLNFESIRDASEDFSGIEKAFDYMLTRADFEKYK